VGATARCSEVEAVGEGDIRGTVMNAGCGHRLKVSRGERNARVEDWRGGKKAKYKKRKSKSGGSRVRKGDSRIQVTRRRP